MIFDPIPIVSKFVSFITNNNNNIDLFVHGACWTFGNIEIGEMSWNCCRTGCKCQVLPDLLLKGCISLCPSVPPILALSSIRLYWLSVWSLKRLSQFTPVLSKLGECRRHFACSLAVALSLWTSVSPGALPIVLIGWFSCLYWLGLASCKLRTWAFFVLSSFDLVLNFFPHRSFKIHRSFKP